MLCNLTNHPYALWSAEQKNCAVQHWGEVEDVPFPAVNPVWSEQQVSQAADQLVSEVLEKKPDAVLCQGEMTMTLALVERLEQAGVPVYAACSQRMSTEHLGVDGKVCKQAVFAFTQFRRYPVYTGRTGACT